MAQLSLDHISLRYQDRALLIGKTGSGKSTLARFLLADYRRRYCQIPANGRRTNGPKPGRIIVIDSKPRWRATRILSGHPIQRRYKNMVPGDVVDGVVLDNLKDWKLAWDPKLNPARTVVVQRLDLESEDAVIRWMVEVMNTAFRTQKHDEPTLLYIDEGMDFFGPTGNARYGNIVQRCFRAGREKGMTTLLGLQRPKTVNIQTLTECNILYLFQIRFKQDMQRLKEMGVPEEAQPPGSKHQFHFFREDTWYSRPMQIPERFI